MYSAARNSTSCTAAPIKLKSTHSSQASQALKLCGGRHWHGVCCVAGQQVHTSIIQFQYFQIVTQSHEGQADKPMREPTLLTASMGARGGFIGYCWNYCIYPFATPRDERFSPWLRI